MVALFKDTVPRSSSVRGNVILFGTFNPDILKVDPLIESCNWFKEPPEIVEVSAPYSSYPEYAAVAAMERVARRIATDTSFSVLEMKGGSLGNPEAPGSCEKYRF
jgi:hypothetical protein